MCSGPVERQISKSDELSFEGAAIGPRIVIHLREGDGIQSAQGWSR